MSSLPMLDVIREIEMMPIQAPRSMQAEHYRDNVLAYLRGLPITLLGGGGLTFNALQAAHVSRSPRWHANDLRPWSVLEIAGEMCGEAGEAANVAKKLLRLELGGGRGNAHSERPITDRDALVEKLKREIGDTIICLAKLAEAGGISLDDAVRTAFNTKSEEMGFPERL